MNYNLKLDSIQIISLHLPNIIDLTHDRIQSFIKNCKRFKTNKLVFNIKTEFNCKILLENRTKYY